MSSKMSIQELEAFIIRLIHERDTAIARVQELERKLAFYENPQTPPSRKPFTAMKTVSDDAGPKKRGAPVGHRGATRDTPVPDKTIEVTIPECPMCHHDPGDPVETDERVIEDIVRPEDVKVRVIRYKLNHYVCKKCGHMFNAKHEDCPQKGNFGPRLLVYTTMLKFHMRGPLRKTQEFLHHWSNFDISPKGIMDMLLRVGDSCKQEYDQIIRKIRKAKWVHIDETGMPVNGRNWWLWIFRTDQDDVLIVIQPSRGAKVVESILGKDWEKPVIVDGWRAYEWIKILQRCWAHLIREVDAYKDESENGKHLSDEIHAKFLELKDVLSTEPPMNVRVEKKRLFDAQMAELAERYSKFEELSKPVTYIRRGLDHWYTCLSYPGMEPTNNLGEQAIREHVIMRNIIGCFRSENGAQNYQFIASLLASWRLQDKNIFEELDRVIKQNLCLT